MTQRHVRIGILCSALLLGACGSPGMPESPTSDAQSPVATRAIGSPSLSTPPVAAATPTFSPSRSPDEAVAPALAERDRPAAGSIAVVVVNDLPARSKPGPGAESKLLKPLLNAGDEVFVAGGPVVRSGRVWYQVFSAWARDDGLGLLGWVAASNERGVPSLLAKRHACPDPPEDIDELGKLPWGVGLACFPGRALTFDAWLGAYETCGGIFDAWTVKPAWLGDTCTGNDAMWLADRWLVEDDGDFGWTQPVPAVIDPKVDTSRLHPGNARKQWISVTVTGTFDHPAAASCHGVSLGDRIPITDDQAVLQCRAEFVITSITRLR